MPEVMRADWPQSCRARECPEPFVADGVFIRCRFIVSAGDEMIGKQSGFCPEFRLIPLRPAGVCAQGHFFL